MALASPMLSIVSRLSVHLLQKDRRRPTRRHNLCPCRRPNGGRHTLTSSEIFPSALNSSVTWMHAKYILESVVSRWTTKKAYLNFLWSASEGHGSKACRMGNLLLVSLLCQENLLPFSLPGTALREKPHGGAPAWIVAHALR